MSSNAMKIVAGVLVLLAVVIAFFSFRLSREYALNGQAQQAAAAAPAPPAVPQTMVVVAAKPLLATAVITKDDVLLVPVQVAPKDFFSSIDDVVGRTTLVDIDPGSPITPRYFKDNNPIAKLIPPGDQAISLELTDVVGVGNFVGPGDVVDVLLYLHNDTGNKIDTAQARILLKDALVLAYDERITAPPKDAKTDEQKAQAQQQGRHQRTVVLAVPEAEATRVMLGASLGEVRLALHGATPTEVAATDSTAAAPAPADGAAAAPSPAAAASPPAAASADAGKAKAGGVDKDSPITSVELAALKPKATRNGAPVPGVQIYRGDKHQTVYP